MQSSSSETVLAKLGGPPAVDQLVEAFYLRMDTLPDALRIRAMHHADLSPMKEVLKRYFVEWMGGPPQYSRERGAPRLRARHLPFKIGIAERDAWLLCMRGALDETVEDLVLRDELNRAFSGLADWMRNQADE